MGQAVYRCGGPVRIPDIQCGICGEQIAIPNFLSSTPVFLCLLLTLHTHSSVPNTTCIIKTIFQIQQDIKLFHTHGFSVTNYYHEVKPLVVIVTTRSQCVGFSCSITNHLDMQHSRLPKLCTSSYTTQSMQNIKILQYCGIDKNL